MVKIKKIKYGFQNGYKISEKQLIRPKIIESNDFFKQPLILKIVTFN